MRYTLAVPLIAILIQSSAAAWTAPAICIRQPELIPPNKTLTISDAINLALKNQPSVRQAAAQVEVQTGLVGQARSKLLPSTSVNGSAGLFSTILSTGTTIAATENQLLYDFSRSRLLLTQAQLQWAASIWGLKAATSDTVFNVKTSYYTVLRTSRLVQVFEENVKAQDEHVAQAQARLDAGLAPKSDVLKAAAAAASARVDLVAARNNADQARVDLNTAMGVDVRSAAQIKETAEASNPVPSLDEGVDLAIKNRPEMCQAMQNVAASEAALKSAETGNLPAFSTSVGAAENFGGDFGNQNSLVWLLNLQWTPFDAGFTRGVVTQAQGQLTSAEETAYTTRQTVSRDVVSARLNILAAQEALTSARAEVASAKENVDAATGRYEAGIGIFLEVLDAQSALLKAQVDEALALYGLSTARTQLEHAIGVTAAGGGMCK